MPPKTNGILPAVQARRDGKRAAKRVRTPEAFRGDFGFFGAEKKDRFLTESLGDSQRSDFIAESHSADDQALNFLLAEEADNPIGLGVIADESAVGERFIGNDDFKIGDFSEDLQTPLTHLRGPIFVKRYPMGGHET